MAESKKVRCVANIPQPLCKKAENGAIWHRRTAQGITSRAELAKAASSYLRFAA
jgi:hypothetical protein